MRPSLDARAITLALKGQWRSDKGIARCPAHDDREPSLSIATGRNGTPVVMCFAGCSQRAVLDALKAHGLWVETDAALSDADQRRAADMARHNERKRIAAAIRLWREAKPIGGSVAETYLRERGLRPPFPPSLRFAPQLLHTPSGLILPAMIAAVQRADRTIVAVHRTFLAEDGSGKAPVSPNKMILGPSHGGAVRLAAHDGELIVGEGIESTLSAMQVSGLPGWAALSTSGLMALQLAPDVRALTIAADNDENGAGQRAAYAAAARWTAERRSVRVALPPVTGSDFNDLIEARL